jgi:hypothetical protein
LNTDLAEAFPAERLAPVLPLLTALREWLDENR